MSNPFETPPSEPPKPAEKKFPAAETPKSDKKEGLGEAQFAILRLSPETPSDAEILRDYKVPVPYTAEEMAAAKARLDADYIEPETAPLNSDEQTQKEKGDLENLRKTVELMDEFELKYPLSELHAITSIPLAALIEHPIRKPANIALVHIRKAMNLVSKRIPELDDRYARLSRAVGMYNSQTKTVDHDRI